MSGPYGPSGLSGPDPAAFAAPVTTLGPAASGPVTTEDRAGPDLKPAQSPGGGSLWASAWRRLRTDPVAILGFVIVAAFVVIALVFALVHLLVDLSYGLIDPRVRVQ